jgi:hypothetical protein
MTPHWWAAANMLHTRSTSDQRSDRARNAIGAGNEQLLGPSSQASVCRGHREVAVVGSVSGRNRRRRWGLLGPVLRLRGNKWHRGACHSNGVCRSRDKGNRGVRHHRGGGLVDSRTSELHVVMWHRPTGSKDARSVEGAGVVVRETMPARSDPGSRAAGRC